MVNLNIDINLMKLSRVGIASIHGVKCVVIPIEENDIYVSSDAQNKAKSAHLHVSAWENKNGASRYGDTHYIKVAYGKEFREAHPEVTQQSPIIGNVKPVKGLGSNAVSEVVASDVNGQIDNGDDDLPF